MKTPNDVTRQELRNARIAMENADREGIQAALDVLAAKGGGLTRQELDEAKRQGYKVKGIKCK